MVSWWMRSIDNLFLTFNYPISEKTHLFMIQFIINNAKQFNIVVLIEHTPIALYKSSKSHKHK